MALEHRQRSWAEGDLLRGVIGVALALALVTTGCSDPPSVQDADTATPTVVTLPPSPEASTSVATTSTSAVTTTAAESDSGNVQVSAEAGAQLANSSGCTGCHTTDGSPSALAPSLFGLAGGVVQLDNGSSVVADADYLRRSITDPSAELVDGDWATAMPGTYQFTDPQLESLVLFIESLGP